MEKALAALLLVLVASASEVMPDDQSKEIVNKRVFYSMLDVKKHFSFSSFRIEEIDGQKHASIVTGPLNVFSGDLNAYYKYTLKNPNNKSWWHAVCTTAKDKATNLVKPSWELIPEGPLPEENWARISTGGRFIGWREGTQDLCAQFNDPMMAQNSCWVRFKWQMLWSYTMQDSYFFGQQDCFDIGYESLDIKWKDALPCYTEQDMLLVKAKEEASAGRRRYTP